MRKLQGGGRNAARTCQDQFKILIISVGTMKKATEELTKQTDLDVTGRGTLNIHTKHEEVQKIWNMFYTC